MNAALEAMGLTGAGTSADELWEIGGREAIGEHLRELADARLTEREAEVGEADWAQVERLVLVRTIDSLWVEHLTELDDMRRGIGLRGYAQQDPLNEFRREAFRLYEELRGLIRHGVASSIFRVTVQRQPPPEMTGGDPAVAQALARGAAAIRAGGTVAASAVGPVRSRGRGVRIRRRARRPSAGTGHPERPGDPGRRTRDGRQQRPGSQQDERFRPAHRLHPGGHADRAERCVLVRVRRKIQEMPRPLS
ncbi:MAG: hypothetical protein WKF78_08515 [Candidatus Limnocylindrales bacterium]